VSTRAWTDGSWAPPRVSADGRTALTRIALDRPAWDTPRESGRALIALARDASGDGLQVDVGGASIRQAGPAASPEAIGLVAAAVVLLVAFGSLVAAALPLVVALVSLGISASLVGILTAVMPVPDWAPAVASLIGIGVGLDYALLILTRFRAELARGAGTESAVVAAVSSAGRSVLLAGAIVTFSLLGLFLVDVPYLRGVAVSASLAVLVVMAASVTMLPALLAWAGPRVDRLSVPGIARGGRASATGRWIRAVQRRPRLSALAACAVLLALIAPVAGLRLGFPDAGNDRRGTETRAAYDQIARGFGAGANGQLLLVADVPDARARQGFERLVRDVRATPGVASAAPQGAGGSARLLAVVPASSPQDPATHELVRRLRADVIPAAVAGSGAAVHVGGATAGVVDMGDALAARLPVFIGGVLVLAFVLLIVAFRAPVMALKAGVLNLLSIGAAYGVVALFAQWGALGGLVGITPDTPVPAFVPVIMFAILFGLSMDYEVFILSRVREELELHGDQSRALADGIAKTARVITAAAAIMVAVFSAFVASPEVFLRLMGIGMATAIIVDVTVIRLVLVPAIMQLLGRRNWWIPRWLDRVIPDPVSV
jgi:RND superfamily putative drug exporter